MLNGVRTIDELELAGKYVFMRVDFNVPMKDGKVNDRTRIEAAMQSILHAMNAGAKVVLGTHLGRPKGKPNLAFSLEPVAHTVAEYLPSHEIVLSDDCIGDGARKVIRDLRDGQVALLENLRFHPGESTNDIAFARELSTDMQVYINDAFGVCHREHASICALPSLIDQKGAGFLLAKELHALDKLRQPDIARPYVAVLGGAKVSDKIGILEMLLQSVDAILIGGAMANTFLCAQGHQLGYSRIEEDKLALARSILDKAKERGVEVLLPSDVRVSKSLESTEFEEVSVNRVPADSYALDIGADTCARYRERLRRALSVFWNGPMGLFENPAFAEGTKAVARAIAESPGFTVVGGGDSVAAVEQTGLAKRFGHVSTGGGASLVYLERGKLPGVEALKS